jgi:hypothetical protein
MNIIDDETDEEDELEDELEGWNDREFVSDVSGDEDDGLSELEDVVSSSKIGPSKIVVGRALTITIGPQFGRRPIKR